MTSSSVPSSPSPTGDTITVDIYCPRWGYRGHNEIIIKGWLPWRRYAVCVSCGFERRVL